MGQRVSEELAVAETTTRLWLPTRRLRATRPTEKYDPTTCAEARSSPVTELSRTTNWSAPAFVDTSPEGLVGIVRLGGKDAPLCRGDRTSRSRDAITGEGVRNSV